MCRRLPSGKRVKACNPQSRGFASHHLFAPAQRGTRVEGAVALDQGMAVAPGSLPVAAIDRCWLAVSRVLASASGYNHATVAPHSRHPTRRLRSHRADRRRRHGPGVPRDRHEAEAAGRHQGPPTGGRRRRRPTGPLPAGSRSPRLAESSEHRGHLRARGKRTGDDGPRDGTRRGRRSVTAYRAWARFRSTRRCRSPVRSPTPSKRRTSRASFTAISSRRISKVGADGTVKVLDFGLAKALDRPARARRRTP